MFGGPPYTNQDPTWIPSSQPSASGWATATATFAGRGCGARGGRARQRLRSVRLAAAQRTAGLSGGESTISSKKNSLVIKRGSKNPRTKWRSVAGQNRPKNASMEWYRGYPLVSSNMAISMGNQWNIIFHWAYNWMILSTIKLYPQVKMILKDDIKDDTIYFISI